jgi:hypothetical protein
MEGLILNSGNSRVVIRHIVLPDGLPPRQLTGAGGRGAAVMAPRPQGPGRPNPVGGYPAASAGTSVAALGVPRPVTGSQPVVAW